VAGNKKPGWIFILKMYNIINDDGKIKNIA
jgi:hypothetical protein